MGAPDAPRVSTISFVATHSLIPLILGSLFAMLVLPLHALVFWVWLCVLVVAARRHFKAQQTSLGRAAIGIQVFVMVAVITAAHLAPVKTTDRVLSQPVTLARMEMTLGEIQECADPDCREAFPIRTSRSVAEADASVLIRFPSNQLTLRQLATAIEDQSKLRHSFAHCGNGWTLLWGGDCSFGMIMREPYEHYR